MPLVLAGWCRYKTHAKAAGWMNSGLALNAYCTYRDGTTMPELSACFGQYDHGPQFSKRVICPDKPLAKIEIRLPSAQPDSEAAYKDITLRAARYWRGSPNAPCDQVDHQVVQHFTLDGPALSGRVAYQPAKDCIEARCFVTSRRKADRAISAWFAIPVDAVGGKWYDDFRNSRRIEPGRVYRTERWYGAGRDGYESRYPIGCVETAGGVGFALGVAIDEPRVFQIEYDSTLRELRVRFDLGLSPDAGTWANRGSFTVYLFSFDPGGGFRAAADKYHRLFGWAFMEKRVTRDGLWMAFLTPESVPNWQDFQFRFVEAVRNIGWDEREGLYSLKYVEPWIYHQTAAYAGLTDEVKGARNPKSALAVAGRLAGCTDPRFPPDMQVRHAGYP
ncbi:MAG: hypothetical protein ACPL7K_09020, partial [Armatimonadota bacterium]